MDDSCRQFWRSSPFTPATFVYLVLGHFAVSPQLSAQPALSQRQSIPVSASRGVASKPTAAALAFTGVTVVDVADGRLVPEQTVVVTGNRVQTVGPMGKIRVPAGAQVVEAKGKYLIPGLWDMHVHVNDLVDWYPRFIAHGVTGVREMAQRFRGGADSFRVWQREFAAGTRVGPRMVGPSADLTSGGGIRIRTPADATRIIDSLKAAGMVFLKYHDNRGNPELYFAMLRAARQAGLPVVGHIPRTITEVEVADSGQRGVEHTISHPLCWPALATLHSVVNEFDTVAAAPVATESDSVLAANVCGQAAEAYIRSGTWLVPTLAVAFYMKRVMQPRQSFVRTMRQRGVIRFLTGTDTSPRYSAQYGISPGVALLQELVFLVESGLTPLEVLQTATLNPAKFLEATDSLGTVAPNKLADLVLLDADPLANIYNVMKIRAVVVNGRYFDRAALDALDPTGMQRVKDFAEQRPGSAKAVNTGP
jgi:cytosine/adenosine deaminase-related metal-dependent hydrolase